jgi:hypothetical protein
MDFNCVRGKANAQLTGKKLLAKIATKEQKPTVFFDLPPIKWTLSILIYCQFILSRWFIS